MSRKLRTEAERAKHANEDLQYELDKLKLQKEKIYAPVVWLRIPHLNIRIQDLKANYYDEIIKMIEDYYLDEELLCRNSHLKNDPPSLASFKNRVMLTLKDTISLLAIDEGNDDAIAGALLLKVVHKSEFGRVFSRIQLVDGDAHVQIIKFTSHVSRKIDIYDHYHCDLYLRYYLLCIKPEYRKKELGSYFFRTGLDVARSLNIPVMMGIFSMYSIQKLALDVGMGVLHETHYTEWKDSEGEMIFPEPGAGNYTCAIMGGTVPAPPPPASVVNLEAENEAKLTRAEKLAQKAKKAAKAK